MDKQSQFAVLNEHAMGGRKVRTMRFLATNIGASEVHLFEAMYEEVGPGAWAKLPGTEKDLGRDDEDIT